MAQPKPRAPKPRITVAEWRIIYRCVDMIAAGDWDDNSYGERPDLEAILDKIAPRAPEKPDAKA